MFRAIRHLLIWWHYRNKPSLQEEYQQTGAEYHCDPALAEMVMAFAYNAGWNYRYLFRLRIVYVHMGESMWWVIFKILKWFYIIMKFHPDTFFDEVLDYSEREIGTPAVSPPRNRERAMNEFFFLYPEIKKLIILDGKTIRVNPDFGVEGYQEYYRLIREKMPDFPPRFSSGKHKNY